MLVTLSTILTLVAAPAPTALAHAAPATVADPDTEYADLDAEETAHLFWNATVDGDWETVEALCPYPDVVRYLRSHRPIEIRAIGKPFTRDGYAGVFVPYEVQFTHEGRRFVKKHNLALRDDFGYGHFVFDGGI